MPTGKGRSVTEWSQVPGVARPLPEPEPQPVLAPLTTAAIFMVLTIEPGGEDAVRDLLADWAGLQRSVGFRVPEAPLACVAGIGSDAWDRLFSGPRPAELHPFRELTGSVHRAVSTPGDLLFHVRHERMDVCFEFVNQAMIRLAGAATAVDEVHGFRYFDERDLLGFVDGTGQPGHGLAHELEAHVHPLVLDVEEQVARRRHGAVHGPGELTERVQLGRARAGEQPVPRG